MICLPCRTFADLGLPGARHAAMCEVGCPCGHADPVHAAPLLHREQAALIATAYRMISEGRATAPLPVASPSRLGLPYVHATAHRPDPTHDLCA